MSLRFAKSSNGKLAAAFCVNCDSEQVVVGGRCLACKRKVHVKVSKYGNKPQQCSQGVKHQSTAEANRCSELHVLQAAGVISGLQAHPQVEFKLDVNGVHVCKYRADFVYREKGSRGDTVEDHKGFETESFQLKKKLMLACHGIEVLVTRAKRGERR